MLPSESDACRGQLHTTPPTRKQDAKRDAAAAKSREAGWGRKRPRSLEEALEYSERKEEELGFCSGEQSEYAGPIGLGWASARLLPGDSLRDPLHSSSRCSSFSESMRPIKSGSRQSATRRVWAPSPCHSAIDTRETGALAFPELEDTREGQQQSGGSSGEDDGEARPLDDEIVRSVTGEERFGEIEILVARGQSLTTLDSAKGACDWQAFKVLSSISLSHNMLTDITPLMVLAPTLTDVNVSFNRITDLSPLFSCKALRRLWASHNQVSSIAGVRSCPSLEVLNLFHNCVRGPFASLVSEISHLARLTELDLDANPVVDVSSRRSHLTHEDVPHVRDAAKAPEEKAEGGTRHRSTPSLLIRVLRFARFERELRVGVAVLPHPPVSGGVPTSRLKAAENDRPDMTARSGGFKTMRGAVERQKAKDDALSLPCEPRYDALPQSPSKCPRIGAATEDRLAFSGPCLSPRATFSPQGDAGASPSDSIRAVIGDGRDSLDEETVSDADGDGTPWEAAPEEADEPSVASLQRTVARLKQENQNMYGLMKENARLRSTLRLGVSTSSLVMGGKNWAGMRFCGAFRCGRASPTAARLRCWSARRVIEEDTREDPFDSDGRLRQTMKPRPSTALPSVLTTIMENFIAVPSETPAGASQADRPPTPGPPGVSPLLLPRGTASAGLPQSMRKPAPLSLSLSYSRRGNESMRTDPGGHSVPKATEKDMGAAEQGKDPGAAGAADAELGAARQEEETEDAEKVGAEVEAEMLRWENGVLRKRLDRLVAYVELLRTDLARMRRTKLRREEHSDGRQRTTRPSTSTVLRLSAAQHSPENTKYKFRNLNSSCDSPGRPAGSTARDLQSEGESAEKESSDSEDDEMSPSSLFALLADPPASLSASLASKVSLAFARGAADRFSGRREEATAADVPSQSDASRGTGAQSETQRDGCREDTTEVKDASLGRRRWEDSIYGATEEKREDNEARIALEAEEEDPDIEDLLRRNEENLKALRQDLRETEEILSRPASAASPSAPPVSQRSSSASLPSRLTLRASPRSPQTPCSASSAPVLRGGSLDKERRNAPGRPFAAAISSSLSASFSSLACSLPPAPLRSLQGAEAGRALSSRLSSRFPAAYVSSEKGKSKAEGARAAENEAKATLPCRSSSALSGLSASRTPKQEPTGNAAASRSPQESNTLLKRQHSPAPGGALRHTRHRPSDGVALRSPVKGETEIKGGQTLIVSPKAPNANGTRCDTEELKKRVSSEFRAHAAAHASSATLALKQNRSSTRSHGRIMSTRNASRARECSRAKR
ncbi:leucine rich repeat-containing protein [Besnoitia besnoiti]|uniref:Leucine rich repeat-containing protein n=1 Tax=Besnoitia besnoiti TaxID=94643 RepID=A0A2A9MPY3_BESBE|nr:leucine rich repeat-containing protein [Besnoitia besnoiti]PFH38177.1 leucine rich repeat-containing protein [Besnoitia besnoiti]